MIWLREPVDRSGLAAYVHLIRGKADPDRSSRPPDGGYEDKTPHRSLDKVAPKDLEREIFELLSDGEPRTFNHICVELWDVTADIAFETEADKALWRLVGHAIEHTKRAPIHFRMILGRLEGASTDEIVKALPGRQLQLTLVT